MHQWRVCGNYRIILDKRFKLSTVIFKLNLFCSVDPNLSLYKKAANETRNFRKTTNEISWVFVY